MLIDTSVFKKTSEIHKVDELWTTHKLEIGWEKKNKRTRVN